MPKECCKLDSRLNKKLEELWKKYFPTSSILSESKEECWTVITHRLPHSEGMIINGIRLRGPLFENGLFQVNYVKGEFFNSYEIMIEDIKGKCGEISTA